MSLKVTLTGFGLSLLLLATIGSGIVAAAPSHAPGSTSEVFSCSDGTRVTIVSNGNGIWTAGHVVAIDDSAASEILIPLAFWGTFYPDTPVNGQAEIPVFSLTKQGQHSGIADTLRCDAAPEYVSADELDNPYGVDGYFIFTATVFRAGNNH